MPARADSFASPRLRRLAQRASRGAAAEPQERCELCGEEIPPAHRHLLELEQRRLLCVCRACSLLFDRRAAGGGHYRLVPDRRLLVEDFRLPQEAWEQLRIPVEMAFFFYSSQAGRVVAFYPSPMGATESRLELEAWRQLEADNPVLATLESDVEALLVNRASARHSHWVAPIDDCYRLVGVIRSHWRGFSGGREVWAEIEGFFDELRRRARAARRWGRAVPDTSAGTDQSAALAAERR